MLAIAGDHSPDSIFPYIDEQIPNRQAIQVRRSILTIACKNNPDYVVVSADDLEWATDLTDKHNIIIGYNDIMEWTDPSIDSIINRSLDKSYPYSKVGFKVSDTFVNNELNILTNMLDSFESDKNIVEPYFDKNLRAEYVEEVISCLDRIANVDALKLGLKNTDYIEKVFRENINNSLWLSRSGGMSYELFVSRLSNATTVGCNGAVVGSAVWGSFANSVFNSPSSSSHVRGIHERMDEIRNIITDLKNE